MKINLLFFEPMRSVLQKRRDAVELSDDATIRELVDTLIQKYGESFEEVLIDPKTNEVSAGLKILAKDHDTQCLKELRTNEKLKNNDEVIFMLAVSGGR